MKSLAVNSSLCFVSFVAAMMVNNVQDFTRVFYIKLNIPFKVKHQNLFDAHHVWPVVNAI